MEKIVFTKENFLAWDRVAKPTQYDFHRFFTRVYFFKTWNSIKENFFGKSDFSPKIPNFCRIGLPLAKTYWMIVSPQKRVKKIPTICTCQTFIYYVNQLKTNFEVIFKAPFRAKKISKIIKGPLTFKTHHRLSGNADPDVGFSLSVAETTC